LGRGYGFGLGWDWKKNKHKVMSKESKTKNPEHPREIENTIKRRETKKLEFFLRLRVPGRGKRIEKGREQWGITVSPLMGEKCRGKRKSLTDDNILS